MGERERKRATKDEVAHRDRVYSRAANAKGDSRVNIRFNSDTLTRKGRLETASRVSLKQSDVDCQLCSAQSAFLDGTDGSAVPGKKKRISGNRSITFIRNKKTKNEQTTPIN